MVFLQTTIKESLLKVVCSIKLVFKEHILLKRNSMHFLFKKNRLLGSPALFHRWKNFGSMHTLPFYILIQKV